jgi:hypothetical protein
MIKELAKHIKDEVDCTLNEMFNQRKHDEGLISMHNSLIDSLRSNLDKWHNDMIARSERIHKGVAKYERMHKKIDKFNRKQGLEDIL